ncbi:NADPH-dependent FMN reductase [Haloferax sulfurifontis]|uniref:NADPH-dependent FMN reductase n=1 Tax=Haloferax sulfurifontis ATCC BAA-897 TaxID=662480 RepID=M0IR80_9EURY|nr:NAD(P)H-dependent oxidoreductase [Haloferax sulfurifontis]ELZ99371.1 NADPH-dependent FMN reductase [Haloferax sulfurifontis ATCC BAA-897]
MMQPHVVAVCGSLRDHSYTRLALEHVLAGASAAGGTTELVDLREYDLPPLDADFDEQGDSAELVRVVDGADAVILGTPVYHGSYSGVLKNALDYCGFDEFGEKTVGLLAVAGGSFPVTALEHLRSVCRSLNSWVLPHQVAIPRVSSSFDGDDLASEDLRERVERLGRDAVVYANIEPEPPTFESGENVGADD